MERSGMKVEALTLAVGNLDDASWRPSKLYLNSITVISFDLSRRIGHICHRMFTFSTREASQKFYDLIYRRCLAINAVQSGGKIRPNNTIDVSLSSPLGHDVGTETA